MSVVERDHALTKEWGSEAEMERKTETEAEMERKTERRVERSSGGCARLWPFLSPQQEDSLLCPHTPREACAAAGREEALSFPLPTGVGLHHKNGLWQHLHLQGFHETQTERHLTVPCRVWDMHAASQVILVRAESFDHEVTPESSR